MGHSVVDAKEQVAFHRSPTILQVSHFSQVQLLSLLFTVSTSLFLPLRSSPSDEACLCHDSTADLGTL